MSKFKNIAIASLLALGTASTTLSTAHAVSPNFPGQALNKLKSEGFRACKALGKSGYTGYISGQVDVGGFEPSGPRNFTLRTCFESRAECNQFISRIHHKVGQIERIYRSTCTVRS